MKKKKANNQKLHEEKYFFCILMLLTAQIDLTTSTLHWFAQIGDDFTSIGDDGGGKMVFALHDHTKQIPSLK